MTISGTEKPAWKRGWFQEEDSRKERITCVEECHQEGSGARKVGLLGVLKGRKEPNDEGGCLATCTTTRTGLQMKM